MLSFTLEPACVTSTLFLIDFHDPKNEKMFFIACHISENIPLNGVKLNTVVLNNQLKNLLSFQ